VVDPEVTDESLIHKDQDAVQAQARAPLRVWALHPDSNIPGILFLDCRVVASRHTPMNASALQALKAGVVSRAAHLISSGRSAASRGATALGDEAGAEEEPSDQLAEIELRQSGSPAWSDVGAFGMHTEEIPFTSSDEDDDDDDDDDDDEEGWVTATVDLG
jgi:hypothetical protein